MSDKSTKYHNKSPKKHEVHEKDTSRRNEKTYHASNRTKLRDERSSKTGHEVVDPKRLRRRHAITHFRHVRNVESVMISERKLQERRDVSFFT